MKYKVLKDIRNIYKKDEVLDLTQGELDYWLRISVDDFCSIEELICDWYIEELICDWYIEEVPEEKKQPKFRIGDKVKVKAREFFTTIKAISADDDSNFKYLIDTYNSELSMKLEEELERPTDYELWTYY